MLKLARLGAATLLGLLMAITLIVPGAFAQSVNAHHDSATQAAHTTTGQQVTQPLSMKWGGGGWGGWGGGWDGGWGGWGGGWDGCGC
jgi:hypothetical protein